MFNFLAHETTVVFKQKRKKDKEETGGRGVHGEVSETFSFCVISQCCASVNTTTFHALL